MSTTEVKGIALVKRSAGNYVSQTLEVDFDTATVIAAWPPFEDYSETPRMVSRESFAAGDLKGPALKAYRTALKTWDRKPFNYDEPAPKPAPEPEPVQPPSGIEISLTAPKFHHTSPRDPIMDKAHLAIFLQQPTWLAKINGRCEKYGWDRTFLNASEGDSRREQLYRIQEDGLYQAQDYHWNKERRYFLRVSNGVATEIETAEVEAAFPPVAVNPTDGRQPIPGILEIAAACEAESTPLVPRGYRDLDRPVRDCIECGWPIYGEHCTHCMES